MAVEYDHKYVVKYKSFQKITQIKPEVAIAIAGLGYLKESVKRAERYRRAIPLYVISLKHAHYKQIRGLHLKMIGVGSPYKAR